MIREEMSDQELFSVLSDMLFELKDGHVNLTSPFDRSRNWEWFLNYPPNFNKTIVYRNYLGNDYRITGPLHNQVIDSVLYIYYESFASEIKQFHLDEIIVRAKDMKGIIIDIRNNGGGAARNGTLLASVLTDVSYVYGYSRVKSGPG
ncbi:S41 family peptidase, partial [Arthrospira platensis SPKY1]|nr:S41 family peptidase [Arthrospira platensis SPKY1]